MIITTQDGKCVSSHTIQFRGNQIFCMLDDSNKEVLCGEYPTAKRAMIVYSEMTCEGWNNSKPEYVMPKE